MKHLVAIGLGYSALRLAQRLAADGWRITGTSRSAEGVARLRAAGFGAAVFAGADDDVREDLREALAEASHVLISVPPGAAGDPGLCALGDVLLTCDALTWVGYFSTVGVYGDHDGAWVDETTPPRPASARGRRRLDAEMAWQAWGARADVAVNCLRLPGIYGPGRSALDRLRAGDARRIIKPGQVFNRIHVDDIAGATAHIMASDLAQRHPVINLSDDLPSPPQDVIVEAARLAGVPAPPEIAFEGADLSAMARSFYGENKRVSNRLLTATLGYRLHYPTYRDGLAAIAAGRQHGAEDTHS